jgi:3-oxoacyl-[acyl-carrier-protein] synthase II
VSRNRVVVTGLGVLSPIGLGTDIYWRNLTNGVSGIDRIRAFDASNLAVQIAGEVDGFDPADHMDAKAARRMGRFAQLSVAASRQALDDSRLDVYEKNKYAVGAVVATGGGGCSEIMNETIVLVERGPDRVNPLFVPAMISNMACHFLRRGDAEAILTGGTESAIVPLSFISLNRIGALSRRNGDPQRASRPFDKDRDGFVFGEGAAVLMLETLDSARARGAEVLAELAGVSHNSDAYHITAPEPSGESAARAMQTAIADAGLAPDEIEYICAHGTGTPLNDVSETRAIKQVFGDYAYKIPISSPKSMIGHLLGAAGAMSALTCVLAMSRGCIPPTINLDEPDPECDLDYVANVARDIRPRTAMANGFGFGGQNAVIVFKAYEE